MPCGPRIPLRTLTGAPGDRGAWVPGHTLPCLAAARVRGGANNQGAGRGCEDGLQENWLGVLEKIPGLGLPDVCLKMTLQLQGLGKSPEKETV